MTLPAAATTGHRFACERPASGTGAATARRLASAIPEIVTPRLRLRAPRAEDFAVYADIVLSPRGRFFGIDTREGAWLDFAQMVATWVLRGHGVWTVEPRDGGDPLGFVLLGLEPGDPEPELGYLFTAQAEGRGIATEAAKAARDHAFADLGWRTLASFPDPANLRSVALSERLGGHRDGTIADPSGEALIYRYAPAAEDAR